jgi:hypothetical protein
MRQLKEKYTMNTNRILIALMFAFVVPNVCADSGNPGMGPGGQGGPGNGGPRHGPPPEAFAACKGKADGAACSFVGRRSEQLTGTCFVPPARRQGSSAGNMPESNQAQNDSRLVCRPNWDGPRG